MRECLHGSSSPAPLEVSLLPLLLRLRLWTPAATVVILVTMTSIPLADAKAHLSEVVSRVSKHHERVTVTVHGQASAVLLSPDDLAMLEETIAVLGDADLMTQLAAAEADLAAGRVETQEDLEAAMRSRRTSA
jgi:antitoxin YefM